MFYNFKTKIYLFTNKKIKLVFFVIIIITIVTTIFLLTKNNSMIEPIIEEEIKEKELDISNIKEKDLIFGLDIKSKYKEVKGSDFAILVTTIELLKEKEFEKDKEYYRYVLDNGDSNKISLIQITNEDYEDAILINYNRVLKDSVVIKDISGGYLAPYGFSDEEGTKFNKYSESKSIKIEDNAVFEEFPIYDGNYKLLGILYIETFNKY